MTLKCIAGIETPDEGRIELNGRVLYDSAKKINLTPQKRRVGYMFQDYALFPNMTVEQNIKAGMGKHPEEEKVRSYINRFRLEGMEKHYPAQLSGGQKQRLALARALLHDSDIYIFDEATSNVDVESENKIMEVIRELAHKKTVILISHRLANVVDADQILVMKDGVIEEAGTHDELMERKGYYCSLYETQQELERYAKEAV